MVEYKVIDTRGVGVPLEYAKGTKRTYPEALAAGLNAMAEEGGWELVGLLGSLMFFKRPRRDTTWVQEQDDE